MEFKLICQRFRRKMVYAWATYNSIEYRRKQSLNELRHSPRQIEADTDCSIFDDGGKKGSKSAALLNALNFMKMYFLDLCGSKMVYNNRCYSDILYVCYALCTLYSVLYCLRLYVYMCVRERKSFSFAFRAHRIVYRRHVFNSKRTR